MYLQAFCLLFKLKLKWKFYFKIYKTAARKIKIFFYQINLNMKHANEISEN